ncbi:MAG TPA: alpha/beta fold hydrolase [Dehalococcoidia bacterium]|nr:alpha/beta fold hydrolase [Dehalococcoidia bacterium]
MPYAKNGDINIYYEVEGEGPPLVLHHGFSGYLDNWREQGYVEALRDSYRLILMDARGHGKSDKPHDPEAYAIKYKTGDVISVINDLGIETTNFFGYSYGGRIGYRLAKYAPERIKSVIVGGAAYGTANPNQEQRIKMLEGGPEAIIAQLEKLATLTPEMRENILAYDCEALIAILKATWDDIEADLPDMIMPFLLFVGESDPSFPGVEKTSKSLPDATFVSLPGLNHLEAASRIDLIIPHIRQFLARVN